MEGEPERTRQQTIGGEPVRQRQQERLGEHQMISDVIKFQNGIVIVFDEDGEQLSMYQGRYEQVKDKILADAPESTRFFHGLWKMSGNPVPRKDW